MKAIICGGRFLCGTPKIYAFLLDQCTQLSVTEIVHGGARGGDQIAQIFGEAQGIAVSCFEAMWGSHGSIAGPIRNREMAQYVGKDGVCIALPGGKGTANMVNNARRVGMRVIQYEE